MNKNYTNYEIQEIWKEFVEHVNHMKDLTKESTDEEIRQYVMYIMAYTKFYDKYTYKHMLITINNLCKTMKAGGLYEVEDDPNNDSDNNIDLDSL